MKHYGRWLLILLIFSQSCVKLTETKTNFVVKKFDHCDPKANYPNKFYGTYRTVGNKQYLDGNATLKVPISNELPVNFTTEMLIGRRYIHIFSLEEKHWCSATHKHMGEFVYEMERSAQLVPGLCPIPPGRYHIHNLLQNYEKMTLQAFPFGTLRLTVVVNDKMDIVTCLMMEVENQV